MEKACNHPYPVYLSLGNWWCHLCDAYGRSHYEPEHRDTIIMPIEFIFWTMPKNKKKKGYKTTHIL